ncbi:MULTISPECIES: cation:proton antiporter [unclassified Pseudoxanthomonas]|uniref:cation:proton antiporter n=1 Tax=unclassified Pseudoxanthomonas TaxID=2645906 RepID=UPI0008E6F3D9|nr:MULTISPECIES: cation:proton antiporter [unclassified Pseudoxanthomonas]PPJ42211.1 cation:proton antiporter [Pseudoxanthomonas sp. KAs_5_3]SFV28182.1 transporter, CPA2 family [Pseudoxanthomonas sp. YR558]
MTDLTALVLDALIFIGLAWTAWRVLGRSIPIAVIPIIIGLLLAATGVLPASWGVPSKLGDQIGFIGVLLLAFTAGLETRQSAHLPSAPNAAPLPRPQALRFIASAGMALLLPFVAGTLAAHYYFTGLPGWDAPKGGAWMGSLAIGLCIAVSALPVLIGIIRELGPLHRPLTQIALRIAVIDDAVLWTGLALLLLAAEGGSLLASASPVTALAIGVLVVLAFAGRLAQRASSVPPAWAVWTALPLFLVAGAWASAQLGLHALLGAYFGGAMVPSAWSRRVPVERLGQFALIGIAPLFFGHSGLKIDGSVLGWASLQASLALLVVAVAAKLVAVIACPPSSTLSRRDALAVGALLQCKGLMEIVAATILRDKGLLSEHAFAALVTLAVLSTLLTGPFFRALVKRRATADAQGRQPV